MWLVKKALPVVQRRFPTILERMLFDITCIGFCDGNLPEQVDNCLQFCCSKLWESPPALPERK